MGLCLDVDELGLYCWNTNTTLISGYRLAVSDLQWNPSSPVSIGTTVVFNLYLTAQTPGNFSQDLCMISLYSNTTMALSTTVTCEVGVMSEGERAEVVSGPLQLPNYLTEGSYNVSIQLLSSSYLVNGEIATVLQLQAPPTPTPTPNAASLLVPLLWGFFS